MTIYANCRVVEPQPMAFSVLYFGNAESGISVSASADKPSHDVQVEALPHAGKRLWVPRRVALFDYCRSA